MVIETIETQRLILRQWQPEDLEPFAQMNQDPLVMEFMLSLLSKEESEKFITRAVAHLEKYGFSWFACTIKETNAFIGFVGLRVPYFEASFTPCVEIGWRLASKYWGHGYATEAARAVLDKAFTEWGLKEVVSFTVPNNVRSRRVMEKLGMTHDPQENFAHTKLSKDHLLSLHVLYRITKEQFLQKKMGNEL
jgi:RimJ/RimL family protein N-acetyltransferase